MRNVSYRGRKTNIYTTISSILRKRFYVSIRTGRNRKNRINLAALQNSSVYAGFSGEVFPG
jgi:hypothetical protein